ncbi:hypothetical protein NHX12_021777, partial [Muraenolepis orangiensis]
MIKVGSQIRFRRNPPESPKTRSLFCLSEDGERCAVGLLLETETDGEKGPLDAVTMVTMSVPTTTSTFNHPMMSWS